MNVEKHIAITVPIAAISYFGTKSWEFVTGFCLSGIFIDVDHLIEFWIDRGFNLNIPSFFEYGNSGTNTRHVILLHSIELMAAFFFIFLCDSTYHLLFYGLMWGMLLHIFLDYINILTRFNYKWYSFLLFFFFFRMLFSFKRSSIDRLLRHHP
jgi:membrane-bound metal-dependent hydrolase YbcI (DUF457 family)